MYTCRLKDSVKKECYVQLKLIAFCFNNKKLHLDLITKAYIQSHKRIIFKIKRVT